MPELIVRLKKKTDGAAALSCERPDGTVTWQRQDGQLGRFFPLHDLTHFAVESSLRFRGGFFGLIAAGWDISTFAEPGVKSRLPFEAQLAELIVGYFDLERATGELGTAVDFEWKVRTYFAEQHLPPVEFRITDEQLADIRWRRSELFAQWRTLPPGETLELRFQ
jgi:hypothetical protein